MQQSRSPPSSSGGSDLSPESKAGRLPRRFASILILVSAMLQIGQPGQQAALAYVSIVIST
jgi:hypothetical protein